MERAKFPISLVQIHHRKLRIQFHHSICNLQHFQIFPIILPEVTAIVTYELQIVSVYVEICSRGERTQSALSH